MKKLLLTCLLCLVHFSIFAEERYTAFVKVHFIYEDSSGECSGVVINNDPITVLTCAHPMLDKSPPKAILAYMTAETEAHVVQCRLIKKDYDKDICLLKSDSVIRETQFLPIANDRLKPDDVCNAHGVVRLFKPIINQATAPNYETVRTNSGNIFLMVNCPVISGMSGGALEKNNLLYGIQSCGSNGQVLYCPADVISKFIKD